jgi:hypothetical protein
MLLLLPLLGAEEGLWPLAELLQLVPYFLIGGIPSILAWGFRKRAEEALTESRRGPVGKSIMPKREWERTDYRRTERIPLWEWIIPSALLQAMSVMVLCAAISRW